MTYRQMKRTSNSAAGVVVPRFVTMTVAMRILFVIRFLVVRWVASPFELALVLTGTI